MIKVNLLKNRGTVADAPTQFDFTQVGAGTEASSSQIEGANPVAVLGKVLGLFSLAFVLYMYESYNIGLLTEQNVALSNRRSELDAEIQKNQSFVERAKQMQTEIKQLEERIAAIKNLSKTRLREIKAIDFLQNVIPDRVWFQSLEFRGNTFKVVGYAATDDSLNRFISVIDGKSFFRTVILLSNEDFKSRTGNIKKFTISAELAETDEIVN